MRQHLPQPVRRAGRELVNVFGAGHVHRGEDSSRDAQGFHFLRRARHLRGVFLHARAAEDEVRVAVHKAGGDDFARSVNDLRRGRVYLRGDFGGWADGDDVLARDGDRAVSDAANQVAGGGQAGKEFSGIGDKELGRRFWLHGRKP